MSDKTKEEIYLEIVNGINSIKAMLTELKSDSKKEVEELKKDLNSLIKSDG